MCPASIRTSQSARSPQPEETKLWLLLVGINHYNDDQLPDLRYSMMDCQGLSEALNVATKSRAHKDIRVHHDGTAEPPTLKTVRASLDNMVAKARPQDTILLYFSGHGLQDPKRQQAVLCLADTQKDRLVETGLSLQAILQDFGRCAARQQLVWLDACHSGGMTLRGAQEAASLPNPMPQMVSILQQRAAQSSGFYALLSCDQDQRSWEFPQLGHGVFTYYLMEGLRGNAANAQGAIEVDSLYRYVYYQTLQYIDKANQQLRLINQQKRSRGDTEFRSEYPLQTPKRIVEGVGEITLAVAVAKTKRRQWRQAVLIDGLTDAGTRLSLGKALRQRGDFELSYWPQPGQPTLSVRAAIARFLETGHTANSSAVVLLYLRGTTKPTETGDAVLVLPDGTQISRAWLRRVLQRSPIAQQIVILDCPGAPDLSEWVEDLQTPADQGQCLLVAAAPLSAPDAFAQALLDTLIEADTRAGLPAAGWITQLQGRLALAAIPGKFWLSGKGIIEVLPGSSGQQRSAETPFDIGLCPYRGLRAFGEDDAAFFFGREALVQRLLQALNTQPFLAVVGASGSGKSSVVQAGLMAGLRQGRQIPGSKSWWVGSLRPGAQPLRALAQKLASGNQKEQLQIEGLLHLGVEGFVRWLRSRPEPTVVLVIDQFEELFSLAGEQARQEFLALMLGAIEYAGDRFKLAITLRADFVASCLEVPSLARALQRSNVLVPPVLSEADYRQIILRPAEKVGLAVEPELVNVLLQDINQGVGDLPLLEFVLEQIWEQRQPGQLTLKVYQEQVGGLKGALERKAQAAYEALGEAAQNCARWIFLNLTQLGEGTEDTRRQVTKSDLVVAKYPEALVEETLGALTAAKLVVVGVEESVGGSRGEGFDCALSEKSKALQPTGMGLAETAEVTVEVAHEILIRHWSTLRWWLEENRSRLRSQRQVEQAAAAWRRSGQQADFLLRGVPLDAAVEIYVNYTDELSREVQAFVEAGLEAREAEQQKTKRQLRRARRAIALISTLAVGVAGFGGATYWQQQQARLREVETLNALSTAQLSNNQSLEATVTAVKAGQQLQAIPLRLFNRQAGPLLAQTTGALQQAIALSAERNRLVGHSEQVNAVAYSPDGQLLASGSDDGTLKIWRADGSLVKSVVVDEHSADLSLNSRVLNVAFSPDGQQIAVAQSDGAVTIWPQTGEASLRKIAAHSDWVSAIAFSPNGETLATAGRDGLMKLWQVADGRLLKTLKGHRGWVNALSWSPDGEQLASGGEDRRIMLWDIESGQSAWAVEGHDVRVTSLDFSADGLSLVSGGGDRAIKLWSLRTLQPQILGEHDDQVNTVAFSPDEKSVLSTGADRQVRLWRVEKSALLASWKGHGGSVLSAAWSPNGQSVASASTDKTIRLWQVPEAEETTPELYAVQFSPEGQTLAGVNWEGDIELWERDDDGLGSRLRTLRSRDSYIFQLAFGPGLLAAASEDGTVRLWDLTDGTVRSLTGHMGAVKSVGFRPDGEQLLSGGADGRLRLWDAAAGAAVKDWAAHEGEVSAIAWSAGSRAIASGSDDKTVKIWDGDGNLQRVLAGHVEAIAALAFSPNGKILVSSAWDNTIKLWRVRDGALLQTLTGHQNGVTDMAFTAKGQVLISSSVDSTLKLWNPQTGALLKTLLGQQQPVEDLSLSPDGKLWVSSGDDLSLSLWAWDLADLLKAGCDQLEDYLRENSNAGEKALCK